MTPVVIDLISSSQGSNNHGPLNTETRSGSRHPSDERREKSAKISSNTHEGSFWHDDIEQVDSSGGSALAERRGSKRIRLTCSPETRDSLSRGDRAAQTKHIGARHVRKSVEIIDFTSSPNSLKQPSQPMYDDRLPVQSSRKDAGPSGETLSSDPFASSPLHGTAFEEQDLALESRKSDKGLNARRDEHSTVSPVSPSLFVTSPKTRLLDSSDPFASSPPFSGVSALPSTKEPGRHRQNLGSPRRRRELEQISSSAPPESAPKANPQRWSANQFSNAIEIDSDVSGGSDSDELPALADLDPSQPFRRKMSSFRRSQSDVSSTRRKPKDALDKTSKSAEERAKEKAVKQAEKEKEKLKRQKEREEARLVKVQEKQRAAALAEANKMKTDKKASTPEMIVDLPTSLNSTILTQVQTMLQELGVQYDSWESPVDNVIKWRRKVRSRYNDELGYWEPVPLDIKEEKFAMAFKTADDLVDLICNQGLDDYMSRLEQHFKGNQIILLVEGMTPWFRTNRNIRNRQFTSGVRSQQTSATSAPLPPTTSRRRNKAAERQYIPEDQIEDALLQLQIEHEILIHHTTVPLETAQWIVIFTQHVATVPYKKQRDKATRGAGFCMESGQVRTGEDAQDTYVKMLQEIARVTAPIAYGIAGEFGSVTNLLRGLEQGGPGTLEEIRKSANKDGALSDRTVGQAVSKRLHKVFTGRDENSTDV